MERKTNAVNVLREYFQIQVLTQFQRLTSLLKELKKPLYSTLASIHNIRLPADTETIRRLKSKPTNLVLQIIIDFIFGSRFGQQFGISLSATWVVYIYGQRKG